MNEHQQGPASRLPGGGDEDDDDDKYDAADK